MALISTILIRMQGESTNLVATTQQAAQSLDSVAEAAARAKASVDALNEAGLGGGGKLEVGPGGGGFDAAALGAQFDSLANRIHSSLLSALAPLGTFAAAFGRQFSQVGGTITETSRRVSDLMRVTGGETLARLFRNAQADPEQSGFFGQRVVRANKEGLDQLLGLTAPFLGATRAIGQQMGAVGEAARRANTVAAPAFDGIAKGINLLVLALDTATKRMDMLGNSTLAAVGHMADLIRAAGKVPAPESGPSLKLFDPTKRTGTDYQRTTAKDKAIAAEEIAAAMAEAGAQTRGVAREAGAVDRFFTEVNTTLERQINLVERAQAETRGFGRAAEAASRTLKVDTKDFSFLSDQDVGRSLGRQSAGGFLNRYIQELSLLGSQFRTLPGIVQTAAISVANFGRTTAAALGLVGLGFRGIQFAAGFFTGGIREASNLNETLNKTDAVLGMASGDARKFADEMAASFGLSKRATLDAAAGFGGLGKELAGLSGESLAQFSTTFTKMAADLSSFANLSFERASESLKIALAGNQSDELKQLGVVLLDNNLKLYAQAQGWTIVNGVLSENQKVAARAALLMEKLGDAHGDLDKTQDAVANQSRKLSGQWQNLSATVGTLLLPAMQKGLSILNGFVSAIASAVEASKSTISGWAESLMGAFEAAGRVVRNFGLYARIGFLRAEEGLFNFLSYVEVLPTNLGLIANYIAGNWRELIVDAVNAVGAVFANLGTNLQNLFTAMNDWAHGRGFNFNWTPLLEGFEATAAKLPELLRPNLISMQGEIDALYGQIAEAEARRSGAAKKAATEAKLPDFNVNPEGAEKDKAKHKEKVGAVELGSKEAASAIASFRNGGAGPEKDIKDVAKTSKAQLAEMRRLNHTLDRKLGQGAGSASNLIPFAIA
jgi:hypothetical protein